MEANEINELGIDQGVTNVYFEDCEICGEPWYRIDDYKICLDCSYELEQIHKTLNTLNK